MSSDQDFPLCSSLFTKELNKTTEMFVSYLHGSASTFGKVYFSSAQSRASVMARSVEGRTDGRSQCGLLRVKESGVYVSQAGTVRTWVRSSRELPYAFSLWSSSPGPCDARGLIWWNPRNSSHLLGFPPPPCDRRRKVSSVSQGATPRASVSLKMYQNVPYE